MSTPQTSTKRYACPYEGCKSSFPRPSKLNIHIQLHEGKIPFQCNIDGCDKGYTTKAHLKRHQSIQHEDATTKVMCIEPECKKEFSNSSNMQKHVKRAHNPQRVYNYTCQECNQSFPKKKLLHQHSYLHTGELYYQCEVCDQAFHLLSEFNIHKRVHVVYACDECKTSFRNWSALRKHKLTHKILFKCNACHYKSYKSIQMKIHRDTHMAIEKRKKYSCKYENCRRAYLYLKNLNNHVNVVHKGIKREKIKCPVNDCSAELSRMTCLRRHLQKIHRRVPQIIMKKQRLVRKDAGIPKPNIIRRLVLGVSMLDDNPSTLDEVSQVLIEAKE